MYNKLNVSIARSVASLRPIASIRPSLAYVGVSATIFPKKRQLHFWSPLRDGEEPKPEAKAEPNEDQKRIVELETLLLEKDKLLARSQDQMLRSLADYKNLEARHARDFARMKDHANFAFAKDLVESVDNLARALEMVPADLKKSPQLNKEVHELYHGIKMTENILLKTLEKHGISKFNGIGEKFNPDLHEATMHVPMQGYEPGVVFHCESCGYKLKDRLLRPARVGVAAPSADYKEN